MAAEPGLLLLVVRQLLKRCHRGTPKNGREVDPYRYVSAIAKSGGTGGSRVAAEIGERYMQIWRHRLLDRSLDPR